MGRHHLIPVSKCFLFWSEKKFPWFVHRVNKKVEKLIWIPFYSPDRLLTRLTMTRAKYVFFQLTKGLLWWHQTIQPNFLQGPDQPSHPSPPLPAISSKAFSASVAETAPSSGLHSWLYYSLLQTTVYSLLESTVYSLHQSTDYPASHSGLHSWPYFSHEHCLSTPSSLSPRHTQKCGKN